MGFIYQQFNLLPALTAEENVAIPLLIQGKRRNAAISEARLMLARVGLSDRTLFFFQESFRRATTTGGHRPGIGQQTTASGVR